MYCSKLFSERDDRFTFSKYSRSKTSWNQVALWNIECISNHNACKPSPVAVSRSNFPARLIGVGEMYSTTVKLIETSPMNQLKPYMTLSHCWGLHIPLCLLSNNYSEFLKGINLDNLPATYRDAGMTTRELGAEFLWIDSLCIIQDSDIDWSLESAKMHYIYRNSWLNLDAAAAKDSTQGLHFERYPLQVVPCRIEIHKTGNRRYVDSSRPQEGLKSNSLILYTRAWVFQEWLLAPRALIFGNEVLLWDCYECIANEIYPTRYLDMTLPWMGFDMKRAEFRNS
ncbi:heterokaryon incompatibility protein-domain-containing protein [Dendryphion nanum]|uniref:Heterokaryon incompatibility protein-domain-containing protein n=1 Tax=Dendryphion nanum TaxID=256645 RepID=A0A9P9DQM2_9PLEO|nr:heterokaryon incompatibility protein-domain-containing protein [Dendryphion nanum]